MARVSSHVRIRIGKSKDQKIVLEILVLDYMGGGGGLDVEIMSDLTTLSDNMSKNDNNYE